ncbi:MAG TPA: Gfo/Idh/MocA family oxidoreductase [Ilumatobacteraceae bacterium]|nr:Gfo/Idh/MocA family oxidoreductase [Ilumatobacteraceae bacterium]
MQRRPDVVLWGAGMVAGVHAAACQALDWRVAAVASRTTARASDLASAVHARATSFEQLLAQQQGDIAIVVTPPAAHVDAAIALLDAGYHVVVEAPMTCTLAEADRLIAAEERVGRPVLYSEHLAAAPTVDGLLVRVGGIGALTHLSARATQAPPTWRPDDGLDAHWGGGALFDLGVHPVGLTLRTAAESGAGRPVSLSSVIVDAGTRHEQGTIQLHFESGLVATIAARWQPGSTPDWDLQASSASAVLRAELYPSPILEHNGTAVSTGAPIRVTGPSLVDDYGYAPQLKRFWTNIRTGRPVPATSRLGRQVLDVICAAHWSAGHDAIDVALPFSGPRDRTPAQLFDA